MNTQDITLHQFAPILIAMLQVRRRYQEVFENQPTTEVGDQALTATNAVDAVIQAAIEAATTEARHV